MSKSVALVKFKKQEIFIMGIMMELAMCCLHFSAHRKNVTTRNMIVMRQFHIVIN